MFHFIYIYWEVFFYNFWCLWWWVNTDSSSDKTEQNETHTGKKTGKQNDHYNSNWLKALKKKKTKLLWEQIQTGKSMFKKILH